MTDRNPVGPLARQIALTFLVFAILLTLGLGLSLVKALRSVELEMLDETLFAELAHFRNEVETARASGAFQSRTTVIHVAPLASLERVPNHLRNLNVGLHDIAHENRQYRVLVEELDGIRYTVKYDDTNILRRDRNFVRVVWLSSILMLVLSIGIGWWLVLRLVRPTDRLAQQLRYLSEQPTASLDISQYQDNEIGLVAKRLKAYHEQLNDLLTREKEFAGNVSHELRTPITTISLAAEVLATKRDLSVKDQEKIGRILRATREMSELVATFLVLSKIDDRFEETHSQCELKPIVEEVISQQRVWLGQKPVEVLVVQNSHVMVAAPARVVSVLIANLVRNAFRYTNKGSITVSLDEEAVSVIDTGIGIDADTQAHLFERNVRGRTSTSDGAGLGLAIVQRICERYGWYVTFSSVEAQGSRFTVRFKSK